MFGRKERQLLELIERQTRSIAAFTAAIAADLSEKGIIDGDTVNKRMNELIKELDVRR